MADGAQSWAGGEARRSRRSVLFCPASRPDRFASALASGADAVCLDLEDGVAPDAKAGARAAVLELLAGRGNGGSGRGASPEGDPSGGASPGGVERRVPPAPPEIVVRINDPRTEVGREDVEALRRTHPPDAVMVPKVDGPGVLADLVRTFAGRAGPPALLPLIETARGLHRVEALVGAGLPLGALVFGGMDLSAELGARFEWEPLLYARSRVVHAAALAGVGAIDVPWAPLDEPEGLEAETRRVARLGFTGKLAIHPAQVPVIHRGLAPDADELATARRVIEAAAGAGGGVVVVDGRMVDRPIVLGAERILARAGEAP
jgi:citrate lyase beta subunit